MFPAQNFKANLDRGVVKPLEEFQNTFKVTKSIQTLCSYKFEKRRCVLNMFPKISHGERMTLEDLGIP